MNPIERTTQNMPMVAMRGVVIFPKMVMHFDVAREASIQAVNAAYASDHQLFLVAQRDIFIEEPEQKDLYEFGVIAEVRQVLKTPDGVMRVLVEGVQKAKLCSMEKQDAFLTAEVKPVSYKSRAKIDDVELTAMIRTLKESFDQYCDFFPRMPRELVVSVLCQDDPYELFNNMIFNINLDYRQKQELLEENHILKRLDMLLRMLQHEIAVLDLERDIQERTKESMDRSQKEFYLREQMHIISEELGDAEDTRAEAEKYAQKIQDLHLDAASEEKLLKECERLGKMAGNQAEISVIRSYLDTVIGLPWHTFTKDDLNQAHARKVLDHDHYGLEKVKERILEILAVRQLNTDVKGQIICLVGPPGVGKTSIARSVAACMGRNFARMSLGGVHDEAEIRGHRRTYIGALPGRIISAINTAKSSNPVILLDEIDKLAGDYRGDPSSALLEVLDPEQNKTFKDNYLDIPFDLSNVLFITTANDASHIPGPLYDRMDVIELPSYTRVEKFNIARRHLLPKQLKNNGLESRVTMAPAALYEIIDGYTREAGVRTLERTITAVLRKCAQKIAAGEKDKINVTPAMVKAMLGPEKVKPTFISRTDAVGIANGLAWTSVGGEMLPIEVSIIPNGSGKVEITGSLGDVMKESAHLALTYARVHAETYHIAPDKFKNTDIHIHAPEGAVPKDGPSAGVTLTTALISALSEIPVRHDLAMTGEITLHGNVLPIGGLKEKSMAAFREGISTVLIPEANKPDLYEVDEEVKKAVKFIPVSDLSQVLKHALILPAASAAHKRTMPQATQLIATEQSTAKEPAAVM